MNISNSELMDDKKEISGWAMYDWANSAFSTTVGTVFLAPYVANLAAEAAKSDFLAKTGTIWNASTGSPLLANFFGIPVAPDFLWGIVFQSRFFYRSSCCLF